MRFSGDVPAGGVAQTGLASLVAWLRAPDEVRRLTGEVFRSAPRELARSVTLQQTVELVQQTIAVAEDLAGEFSLRPLLEQILRQLFYQPGCDHGRYELQRTHPTYAPPCFLLHKPVQICFRCVQQTYVQQILVELLSDEPKF